MPDARPRATSGRRVVWCVLVGAFLLQLAWMVAVPSFRGPDEFDHAYKADAVAAGQLRGTVPATDGRGELLAVRPGVVAAAGPVCAGYQYTGPDNCRPVRSLDDGRVAIASAAASYNPVYYLVVGSGVRFLDGHAFLVGMRVLTATLAALLVATAAATAASRARSAWPLVSLAVALTPVAAMSGGTAAPNGVGYAAGALWWVSALSVVDDRRPAWGRLATASVVLLCTHTMNVVWVPLMILAVLGLRRPAAWSAPLRSTRGAATVLVVLLAGLACVGWIRLAGTNRLGEPVAGIGPLPLDRLVSNQVAWVLQTMATGIARNEAVHTAVYVCWGLVLLGVLVAGWRLADRLARRSALLLGVAWIAVPLALTVVSYPTEGFAWQGRYALPLVMGLVLLAGRALDAGPAPFPPAARIGVLVLGAVHVWCVVEVLVAHTTASDAPSLAQATSTPLAVAVAATVAAAGCATLLAGGRPRHAAHPRHEPVGTASSAR